MKKTAIRVLCVMFAFLFCCISVHAEELIMDIKDELIEEFAFPLHFEAIYDEDGECSIAISIREEFEEVEKYDLDIMHWLLGGTIFSGSAASDEVLMLSGAEVDKKYKLLLTLYTADEERYIEGSFIIKNTDSGMQFKFEHEKIKDILEYEYDDQAKRLSDEEYAELFEQLDIPSFISADQAKEYQHAVRLTEFDDSLDTIGFYNLDGTSTVYIFASPVRYQDIDGTIKDYSADITPSLESVQELGYKYTNRFGNVSTYFSEALSNTQGTKIVSNAVEIEFGLYVEETEKTIFEQFVDSIGNLFMGNLQKAELIETDRAQKIQYAKIGDKKYTVSSEPVINGSKTSVIMETVPEDNKLYFWVNTNGMNVQPSDDELSIYFTDAKTGAILYYFGNVELSDSGTNANIGTSIFNKVKVVGENRDQVLIEVSLDSEFIEAPLASYPLTAAVYMVSVEENGDPASTVIESEAVETETVKDVSSDMILTGEADHSQASLLSAPSSDAGYYTEYECKYADVVNGFEDRTVYTNNATAGQYDPWGYVGQTGSYYDKTTCTYKPITAMTIMKYGTSSVKDIDPDTLKSAQIVLYVVNSDNTRLTIKSQYPQRRFCKKMRRP